MKVSVLDLLYLPVVVIKGDFCRTSGKPQASANLRFKFVGDWTGAGFRRSEQTATLGLASAYNKMGVQKRAKHWVHLKVTH